MTDLKVEGCIAPAGGPIVEEPEQGRSSASPGMEPHAMRVTVGKKAPDFEAPAYVDGGFKNIKLSDYAGKWIFLCFYPGDFTFV